MLEDYPVASPYEQERKLKQLDDVIVQPAWQQSFFAQGLSPVETRELDFYLRLSALEDIIKKLSQKSIGYVKIELLPNKKLKSPFDVVIEPDSDGFLARLVDLPLYGYGDDIKESIEMLKREIESLFEDLMESNDFTDDWLRIKEFLKKRICR